jgi:hypothetical protein
MNFYWAFEALNISKIEIGNIGGLCGILNTKHTRYNVIKYFI